MNEQDVMKALECHCRKVPTPTDSINVCKQECPYHSKDFCTEVLAKDALALLEEKNAEIEWLEGILKSYALQYGTARGKEYFLKKERVKTITEYLEKAIAKSRELGSLKPFVLVEDLVKIANEIKSINQTRESEDNDG